MPGEDFFVRCVSGILDEGMFYVSLLDCDVSILKKLLLSAARLGFVRKSIYGLLFAKCVLIGEAPSTPSLSRDGVC